MKEQQSIKIWKITLRKLRILHAELDQSMVEILDRLINQELELVGKKNASKN